MDFTTLGLILLIMVVLSLMIYIIPIIKKWAASKGIDVNNTLITTDKIFEVLQLLMDESKMLPADQVFLLNNIVEIIQYAIKLTQKMYEDGQCSKDEKLNKVIELVFDATKVSNMTITDAQHDIIVKTVKMLVLLLN